ncbi:MAG: hypothetical protein HQK81_05235 [Desulfovibrionaceae bacterium]|nr:hypothetical protein [Desulfovibrionaceae bacterium]MBF0513450.1 hypothetical protein [Desulfovibrionaceae bacterium]
MKIRGDSARGGDFGDSRERGQDRAGNFRRTHEVGDTVRGRVLRYEPPRRCWVEIDGRELLAEASIEAPVGSFLTFRIISLEPEIVLRDLGEVDLKDERGGLNLVI